MPTNLMWNDRLSLVEAWNLNSLNSKLENLQLSLKEEESNASILKSFPSYYLVEVTNRCNLRCALCPTQYNDTDMPRGFIDIDYYKSIVDVVKRNAIIFELQNWGEPFLHKDIIEIIRYATSNDIFAVISSNFSLHLSTEFLERILSSGLGVLHIDIDGISQSTYETYRRGGNLSIVLKNLKAIINLKQKLGLSYPIVETAMIVNSYNECEVEQYKELMGEIGVDSVLISKLQISPNTSMNWLPNNPEYRYNNYLENQQHPSSCQRLYTSLTINWDGRISPCCLTYDKESDFSMHIQDGKFHLEWNNSYFESARRSFSSMRDNLPHTICHECKNCLGDSNLNHFRDTFAIALRSAI